MGLFVTLEGGEFTGKTSVAVPGLQAVLERAGIPVLVSREPGGTKRGEEIRQQIFDRREEGAPAIELARLFNEARAIHLESEVLPFLSKHQDGVALLDRYADSTFVYQGLEPEDPIEIDILLDMHKVYTKGLHPDVTFLMEIPEDVFEHTLSCRSSNERDDHTAWDRSSVEEHIRRQQLYMELPGLFAERGIGRSFVTVDASIIASKVIESLTAGLEPFLTEGGLKAELGNSFQDLRREGYWSKLDKLWIPPELNVENGLSSRAKR